MSNLPQKARNASTPSLPERVDHREWIGGRVLTLLSHYWRDDDPVELTSAIGQDWADVLEGLPQEYLKRACQRYLRTEPRRKPTPGAIYQMTRDMMPGPEIVPVQIQSKEEQEAYQKSVARDRINPKRKAEADAIMAKFKTGEKS